MESTTEAVTSTVHLPYDAAMRLHITINETAMAKLRKMARDAKCQGDNDRELLQAYLHHITGETVPAWGGARDNSGPKPRRKSRKK